ncbi:probable glycerophosphodiester phosphodiesterase [Bacillus sp. NRRL B-14911]|uniref:GP-PDE domain-containing protein n=1 Tax=Bacillus infantis NRRL B-14911 TaxID=1367477 RepID=U5L8T6_9BACI|nr:MULTISPECIES: glycerophosphodiester phosphodiesterase family protein [Bacillus]AGX03062.1 hypothetical protein N288_05540 [Bacillus infantis NRRL B-14911]EAR64236.1 probable glycerophosphodiester phosphodiesterase [Bacillus sp. NRRL B-14911]
MLKNACVAHRGWSGKAPENTAAAFRLALEHPMISAIELDVHLSRDGIPVVIHDHTLERTTNGSGNVKDHTAAELALLDAGSWFSPEYSGETISSLEEIIQMAKGKKKLFIELKQMAGMYEGLEEKVAGLIRKYSLYKEALVISFDHHSLLKLKELDPRIRTGLIYLGHATLLAEQAAYTGASHVSVHYGFLSRGLVESLLDARIEIGTWTVNGKEALKKVQDLGGSIQITTNHPEIMVGQPEEQMEAAE